MGPTSSVNTFEGSKLTEEEFNSQFEEQDDETVEQRFAKMVQSLQGQYGWSPRKATRYLNAIARRSVRKQMRPAGNKTARKIFDRFYDVPINTRQKQGEARQRELAETVQRQMDAEKALKAELEAKQKEIEEETIIPESTLVELVRVEDF